ncbi:hypothetical protein SLH49_06210 [Cognatiyoonia sp. IB215446]|uniref:hypothetical protein n=1 Tax=Cognatiyoonia sp. IB215446 TaxID=3097355 RepID=UPI002A118D82|nr:hypothetical protein [Cognatiyoonia sp. IB215446]MDX8347577.1 hypothetical protein [Cognatiyoonia sp. IB215446]
MRGIFISLALILAACSPVIEARAPAGPASEIALEEPILAAPMAPVVTPCPADTLASDDGIGGTGCK